MGRHIAILFLVNVVLASCTTYRGVAEFGAFRDAYEVTAQNSDAILDLLAVAERELYKKCANMPENPEDCEPFDPEVDDFDLAGAAYIATAGDPPATAAFRRTVRAVRIYANALNGLASGETSEAMVGRIDELAGVGMSALSANVATGVPAVAASTKAANTALSAFKPIAIELLGFATRDQFRKELRDRAPDLRNALVEVRKGAAPIFSALQAVAIGKSDDLLSEDDKAALMKNRELLANWVVMINETLAAFDIAVAALDKSGPGNFSALIGASQSLLEAARDTRRNLAEIRAN